MFQSQTSVEPKSSDYINSIDIPEVGDDSISCIKFINSVGALAAGSWGGQARVWRISGTSAIPFLALPHTEVVLSLAEQPSQPTLFTTCSDGSIKMFDLQSQNQNNFRLIKQESSPVSCCAYSTSLNVLITGNWNGEVNFWDLRQQNPVHSLKAAGRVAKLDISDSFLVYGTNTRELYSLNIKQSNLNAVSRLEIPVSSSNINSSNINNSNSTNRTTSTLNYSLQDIKILKDGSNVIAAQSSGEVSIVPLQSTSVSSFGGSSSDRGCTVAAHDSSSSSSYYGKKDLFSANAITAHKHGGVFTSGGGDGRVHFMSKGSGRKLFTLESPYTPKSAYTTTGNIGVTCTDFDASCKYFARAYSYDWYKGITGFNKEKMKPKILINYGN